MEIVKNFYDDIAKYYHLIYSNWEQSIVNQADRISKVIKENWGTKKSILDCTCGIGTQSLGLAALGYELTSSDLSENAIKRAKREARNRDLIIDFSVADVREVYAKHRRTFDVVISCDNSLPHLPNDTEFRKALRQMYRCTNNGGGVVISVRDYEKINKTGPNLFAYGVRDIGTARVSVFQVQDFYKKLHYKVNLYFVFDYGKGKCITKVFKSEYYAISIPRIMELMKAEGFKNIKKVGEGFFQPIIIGTKK